MVVPAVVVAVLGACCLIPMALSCALAIVGWTLRRMRGRIPVHGARVDDDTSEIIEGEFRELDKDRGKGQ